MASNPFGEYVWGRAAGEVCGVADAPGVGRAIARHGAEYPGKLEVVEMGRRKMVPRDQLERFTAWYNAGPGQYGGKRKPAGEVGDGQTETAAPLAPATTKEKAAVTDARRASLARQIARLTGM
jgi:hypothetical protein